MHAGNSKQLQTLLRVCAKLLHFLGVEAGAAPSGCQTQQPERARGPPVAGVARPVNDFLFAADLDDLNMFQLVRQAPGVRIIAMYRCYNVIARLQRAILVLW